MNCPSCYAAIEKDFDHCPACEAPLDSAPPPTPDSHDYGTPSKWILITAWIVLVPVVFAGMAVGSAPAAGAIGLMYLVIVVTYTVRYLNARKARLAAAGPRAIWSVHRDGDTVVRIRDDVSQFSDSGKYHDVVRVTWHFTDFDFDAEDLDAFEEALVETVTQGDVSVMAIAITRETGREWVLYALDGKTVARRIRSLIESGQDEISVAYQPDAEWRAYSEAAEKLGEPN